MSGYPPSGSGYPGYPPQQPGAPGAYGQPGASGYPPQQPGAAGAYGQQPGAAGAYGQQPGAYGQQPGTYGTPAYPGAPGAPGAPGGAGYPPAQGGYAPATGGYPPTSGGYPPTGQPAQGGYPPPSGGYQPASGGPPTQGAYPPQSGYPPQGGSQYGAPAPAPAQAGAPQAWYGQYYNQINPQEMSVLQQWFTSVDKDRSGEISAQELAQLNFNGGLLGQDSARKLIAIFDKDRSGQISFAEYASMNQFLTTLLTQYQQSERKTPGSMSINDVPAALQAAGFTLSPSASQNVARRFDTQKRGALTWQDFLLLAAHIALIRSVFEWSDTDRDGKVTFDFEAFAFATLYL